MSSQGHILLQSMPDSAAFDPHASVNSVSQACAISHGIDNKTISVTQMSVTIAFSYSVMTTVLPFVIVNDILEFDIVLGKGWHS